MSADAPDPETRAAWRAALDRLQASLPATTYEMWVQPLSLLRIRGDLLLLSAPPRIRAWVERRYLPVIARAVSAELGRTVSVALEDPDQRPQSSEALPPRPNPAYTFERFVIGDTNHLAHTAALTVAEAPAEAYNPLFIHGPPGLGKTHLLCAIANYLELNAPSLTVHYTTAESFTTEFVTALRSTGVEAFKRRFRDVDALLIDDVQFLEGKQSTEEEFFHTFNALYEAGSQVVLSADRLPSQLSSLADRLRDRFEWGLVAPVGSPSVAVRQTVLNRLVREAGIEIPDRAALSMLAHRVDSSIRQLHGTLTRLIAHASLTSRPFDSELVESVLGPSASPHRSAALDLDELCDRIATAFDVASSDLAGSSRTRRCLRARQALILLARELTDHSLPQIGQRLGGRDHSTIHNSLRRAEDLLDSDPDFAARINRLRADLHSPVR